MTIEVLKQYGKYVSVRDYLVSECIDLQENLVIWHDNKHIVVPFLFLSKKLIQSGKNKPLRSKFNKKTYRLIDFIWKPTEDLEATGQLDLI